MEGYERKPRTDDVAEKFVRYKAEAEERTEIRERQALRNKVKFDKHLRDIRGIR